MCTAFKAEHYLRKIRLGQKREHEEPAAGASYGTQQVRPGKFSRAEEVDDQRWKKLTVNFVVQEKTLFGTCQKRVSFLGGIPTSLLPASGTRRRPAAPVTPAVVEKLHKMLCDASPSGERILSTRRYFESWCKVQSTSTRAQPIGALIALFSAFLTEGRGGLSPGSAAGYCRDLLEVFKLQERDGIEIALKAIESLDLTYAEILKRQAVDEPIDQIQAILDAIRTPAARATVIMMTCSGARAADAARLSYDHIKISETEIDVDFRVRKNGRSSQDRLHIVVPLRLRKSAADRGEIAKANFLTCDALNRVLKKVWKESPRGRPRPWTSYTFRRNFEHAVLDLFTDKSTGAIEYCKAIQFTGHANGKVLRASYGKAARISL